MLDIGSLTFVTRLPDGRLDLWTPERPDDYAAACAMGREYASEMLMFIQETQRSEVFGAVVRAITRAGQHGGVEAGFCSAIGIHLLGIGKHFAIPDVVTPVADIPTAASRG